MTTAPRTTPHPTRPGYHFHHAYDRPDGFTVPDRWRPSLLYLAQMLVTHWGCRLVGPTNGGDYIVSHRPDPDNKPGWYVWWVLCDNGGEINVAEINSDALTRSIPYDQTCGLVPMGRLAFWCSEVMRGEERHDFRNDDYALDDLTLDGYLMPNDLH